MDKNFDDLDSQGSIEHSEDNFDIDGNLKHKHAHLQRKATINHSVTGGTRHHDHEEKCSGHGKFGVHSQNFEDLINEKVFKTDYEVISVIVTNNRARIVATLKKSDQ
jgi:hypothetical protein